MTDDPILAAYIAVYGERPILDPHISPQDQSDVYGAQHNWDTGLAHWRACWPVAQKAENAACALICDEQQKEPECPERASYCADAIRARSTK